MKNIIFSKTLAIDNEKYMITKRLYHELIAQTNLIANFNECRAYIRKSLNVCYKEIQEVKQFETRKIDIEI